MTETLTVLRLGVPPTLARTLRSTNALEKHDQHAPHPRQQREALARWQMALRWCAAGMIEAGKQFRRVNGRVNGHLHLRSLRDMLEKVTEITGVTVQDDAVTAA